MSADKVREDRLRRAAGRQGYTLRKSRTRDPRALTYGVYWLIDRRTDSIVADERGFTLDEVERFLTSAAQPR